MPGKVSAFFWLTLHSMLASLLIGVKRPELHAKL